VVRVCESTYDKEPLNAKGIRVIVSPHRALSWC